MDDADYHAGFERFQRLTQDDQAWAVERICAHLVTLPEQPRILSVGAGNGHLDKHLLAALRHPRARYCAIEPNASMFPELLKTMDPQHFWPCAWDDWKEPPALHLDAILFSHSLYYVSDAGLSVLRALESCAGPIICTVACDSLCDTLTAPVLAGQLQALGIPFTRSSRPTPALTLARLQALPEEELRSLVSFLRNVPPEGVTSADVRAVLRLCPLDVGTAVFCVPSLQERFLGAIARLKRAPEFVRLGHIWQHGKALHTYSRATHSQQVADLAAHAVSDLAWQPVVVFAALVHDIGHGPSSHDYDRAAVAAGHVDHESRGALIVEQLDVGLTTSDCELVQSLVQGTRHARVPERLWHVLNREGSERLVDLDCVAYISQDAPLLLDVAVDCEKIVRELRAFGRVRRETAERLLELRTRLFSFLTTVPVKAFGDEELACASCGTPAEMAAFLALRDKV